jgi:hypothetical protein
MEEERPPKEELPGRGARLDGEVCRLREVDGWRWFDDAAMGECVSAAAAAIVRRCVARIVGAKAREAGIIVVDAIFSLQPLRTRGA